MFFFSFFFFFFEHFAGGVAPGDHVTRKVQPVFFSLSFSLSSFLQQELSIETITRVHAVLMGGNDDAKPGELRTGSAVANFGAAGATVQYLDHTAIADAIETLFASVNQDIQAGDWLSGATNAASTFLLIHPFCDGNGRLARILVSHVLMRALGFPFPVVITNGHRSAQKDWVRALRKAQAFPARPALLKALILQSVHARVAEFEAYLNMLNNTE